VYCLPCELAYVAGLTDEELEGFLSAQANAITVLAKAPSVVLYVVDARL
jgi:hypothetical protein